MLFDGTVKRAKWKNFESRFRGLRVKFAYFQENAA